MSNPVKSLWPEKFDTFGEIPPVAILREQADLLGASTDNIVEGMVVSSAHKNRIVHSLILRAPVLGTRTEIFQIQHELSTLYPCSCHTLVNHQIYDFVDGVTFNSRDIEIFNPGRTGVPEADGFLRVARVMTPEALATFLGALFKSAYASKIIGALISQSLTPAA